MKSKEELNALKEEVETLNKKLAELTNEELEQATGGAEAPCVVMSAKPGPGCCTMAGGYAECKTCPSNPEYTGSKK